MDLLGYLVKLVEIIFVDLVLAGDNAIVIGLVAAKFTREYRRKVILYGVGAAVVLRIVFALITVQLLAIKGLLLVGGLLLLWICWKLWKDLREPAVPPQSPEDIAGGNSAPQTNPPMLAAIGNILVADLSMSLDNVLAVAGIADGDSTLLVIGLALSVAFMTFAAAFIAQTLQKHRWIGYVGLLIIFYVSLRMIYDGYLQLV